MPSLLEMRRITKRYPGVLALDNVFFSLQSGEIHALVGENGAGKSTLMKILSGAIPKDAGEILVEDIPTDMTSPFTAQQHGVSMVYQDSKLVPELTVAENAFLGKELTHGRSFFLDAERMSAKTRDALKQLGEEIDTEIPVKSLSAAQRQIAEIAKALLQNTRILIMDEPTAALTGNEIGNLFKVIRMLKSEGVGIIYISHRLDEIFEIADRVTVLRDGVVVKTCKIGETDRNKLIELMVGRPIEDEYPKAELEKGEQILRLEALSTSKVKNVDLVLCRGEILGIGGLIGSGRTELARAIFGADPVLEGKMVLEGKEYRPRNPRDAIEHGIGLLTEDRNLQGLILQMSVRENISLSNLDQVAKGLFIDSVLEKTMADEMAKILQIKTPSVETGVETLSGGTRQKVVLGRWLSTKSKILIFDEPTLGIDVGAKYEIYNLMNRLALDGIGIIIISSDLPELIGMSDRIAVMCAGRVTGILSHREVTQEKILNLATAFN